MAGIYHDDREGVWLGDRPAFHADRMQSVKCACLNYGCLRCLDVCSSKEEFTFGVAPVPME